jgi:putative ABC transport system permease protein
MIQHYIKIAFRSLVRSKGFSFINIFGLATGMTACVLIMLYVTDELSYDKHHKARHRLYRIASEAKGEKWVAAPAPMAEALKKDFPDVEQATRLLKFPGTEKMLLKFDQKHFFEPNGYYVDSTFFELFNYEFKFGDIRTALLGPNTIVISDEVATRFFGNENPVDQMLTVGLPFGEFNYTIKGVFKNQGNKSHIPSNLFLSMNNNDIGGWVKQQTKWVPNAIFHTYVKLKEGSDEHIFESKLDDFLSRYGGDEFKAAGFERKLFLQPVQNIYLYSNYGYEIAPNGNITYLYIFTSIAVFLLLIACINFMNLSTARSEKRAKEVSVRKINGADKRSLVSQFLGESLLMSALALMFTIMMVQMLIPAFNQLTHKNISLVQSPNIFVGLTLLTLLTGLVSGLYPAFYLSSFKSVSVFKGATRNSVSAATIRKGLVVFQFTISIVLILSAILISQQMSFMNNQNLGFDKNQKIVLPLQTREANDNVNTLKNELLSNSQVMAAAKGGTYPGMESITSMLFYAEGKAVNKNIDIKTIYAEPGYIQTLGIQLLQGREFAKEFANDHDALILNEEAVKQLGYTPENAVGKKVYFEFQSATQTMSIIGVVRDYHFQSLHQKIKPMALSVSPIFDTPTSFLILNVNTSNYPELIATLHKTWERIVPNSPFAYSFLDQDFQKNYENEERTAQLVQYFTFIAIVIACLGLFGLATFTAEQRIKEIGVRKVLGASVSQIVTLLSKDFMKLVMIAIILSSPLAYYIMNEWLSGFAYRIDISWWVFAVAGTSAVLIALLTVSVQAIRAALANPVESLKSE